MAFHELKTVIDAADRAIMAEDFDALMDLYDERATLVVKPGLEVSGKEKIRAAFVAIADYFNHSLKIAQDRIQIVEGGDTALVLAEATLVVKPGLEVSGKEKIRAAFVAIADYFNHSLKIAQDRIQIVEGGDTALVLAEATLETTGANGAVTSITRRATYVFRKVGGKWLCLIDNSYGTDLLDVA